MTTFKMLTFPECFSTVTLQSLVSLSGNYGIFVKLDEAYLNSAVGDCWKQQQLCCMFFLQKDGHSFCYSLSDVIFFIDSFTLCSLQFT